MPWISMTGLPHYFKTWQAFLAIFFAIGSFLTVLILVLALLMGCSNHKPAIRSDSATTFSMGKAKSSDLIEAKLYETLEFCAPRLQGAESKAEWQARVAYWMSMTGLIAGSVVVPALAAINAEMYVGLIAGLSGWSGASHFASKAMETSGLSGSAIAETRNRIIKELQGCIEVATDGDRPVDERRGAIMRARAACVAYEISVPRLPEE